MPTSNSVIRSWFASKNAAVISPGVWRESSIGNEVGEELTIVNRMARQARMDRAWKKKIMFCIVNKFNEMIV
jgi:hypothetical protein